MVHAGVFLSTPMPLNTNTVGASIQANYEGIKSKFVGGEMEGKLYRLLLAAQEVEEREKENGGTNRTIAAIVIKGVADYGDGSKTSEWQPIAAKAAAHYAEFMLKQVSVIASYRDTRVCVSIP